MALTLAGEPVLLDVGGQIEEMVNNRLRSYVWPALVQYQRELESSPFVPSEHEDSRFSLPYGDAPAPRLNEFVDPTGIARYGRGMYLVGRETMAAIAEASFGYSGDLTVSPDEWADEYGYESSLNLIPLEIDFGDQVFTRDVMPFAPLAVESLNLTDLWLVPVVDIRYQWIQLTTRVEFKRQRSWEDLIEIFLESIGLPYATAPTIDERFLVPDPRTFADVHVSPAVALDAIMLSLGYRSMLNDSSELEFQDATTAKSILATELEVTEVQLGGRSPEMPLSDRINVSGPRAVNYVDCECWEQEATVPDGGESVEPFAVWSSFYEQKINGAVPAQNSQEREQLLGVIGETLDDWNTSQGMISLPGVHSTLRFTTCFDYVSFYVRKTESIYTSAITFPPDFFPRVNFSQYRNNFVHLPSGSDWLFWTNEEIPVATETYEGSGVFTPGSALAQVYEINSDGDFAPAETDSGMSVDDIPLLNHSPGEVIEAGKLVTAGTISKKPVAAIGGSGTIRVHFEIVSVGEYGEEYDPPEIDGEECEYQPDTAPTEVMAIITRFPCGATSVPGQDYEGRIELHDTDGWLDRRSADELIGARGSASYLSPEVSDYPDSYHEECEWVIDMINLFRERRTQVDTKKEASLLRFKFESHSVWDHCKLKDYTIPLKDCEEEEYYDGGGV